MDPFHERLARIALDEAGSSGFALAGGSAVQAHGFLSRLSSDVDLFAEAAEFDFAEAVDVVVAAYQRERLQVETELRSASFARLDVRSAAESLKVEMGLEWKVDDGPGAPSVVAGELWMACRPRIRVMSGFS